MPEHGVRQVFRGRGRARCHALETGAGPGAVIFFPAAGDSASSYRETLARLASALAGTARAIAVDPPGYGRALLPGGEIPSFAELMDWASRAWADETGPLIFVGNSSGGAMATAAAVAARAAGLVLVGWPDWRVARMPMAALLPATHGELDRLLQLSWHAPPTIAAPMAEILLQRYRHPAFRDHVQSLDPAAVLAQYDAYHGALMFISGHSDRLVPTSAIERSAARRPGATVHRLADCGHFPHRERGDLLVQVLEGFVRSLI